MTETTTTTSTTTSTGLSFEVFRAMLHSTNHNHNSGTGSPITDDSSTTHDNHHHQQQQQHKKRMIRTNQTIDTFQTKMKKNSCSITGRIKLWIVSWFIMLLRISLIDIPLCFSFTSLLGIYYIRTLYDDYYVTLFDRSARTNKQLHEEHTYYQRQCNDYDITTHNVTDMIIDGTSIDKDDDGEEEEALLPMIVNDAKHKMLHHGAIVIRSILSPHMIEQLRNYIVYKNDNIPNDEKYPVSQGHRRLSYGIDASEHLIVSNAIHEIISHNITRSILTELLGDDDPASAEITAITAYYGAPEQAWHMDTKIDGNAVKYARTYSHSYSLFIPLQDTTYDMGITDICPGSHFCSNDVEELCERTKMSLHQAGRRNDDDDDQDQDHPQHFDAGDGALLNQHIWHRGGKHIDPTPHHERIVFIMSFIARPPDYHDQTQKNHHLLQGGIDTRQLSRGTYFHQKWNMWGHVISDLLDAQYYMKYPYSILRCLCFYTTNIYSHYGYDLITATYMRFMNGQLEDDDLENRLIRKLDKIQFPTFLRGVVLSVYDGYSQARVWRTFLASTIQNLYDFIETCTIYIHGIFLVGIVIISCIMSLFPSSENRHSPNKTSSPKSILRSYMLRFMITHSILYMIYYKLLYVDLPQSSWGRRVKSGMALMRPFPSIPYATIYDEQNIIVSNGPTTFPSRHDILVGTRYDATFLGSYNLWLQYHPGNRILHQIIHDRIHYSDNQKISSNFFVSNPILLNQFVNEIIDHMVQQYSSRFLQQDYRNGDWRIMSYHTDVVHYMIEEVIIQSSLLPLQQQSLRSNINRMMAHYRYGSFRHTKYMSTISQYHIWYLKQRSFHIIPQTPAYSKKKHQQQQQLLVTPKHTTTHEYQWKSLHQRYITRTTTNPAGTTKTIGKLAHSSLTISSRIPLVSNMTKTTKSSTRLFESSMPTEYFKPGTIAWCYFGSGSYFPGTIMTYEKVIRNQTTMNQTTKKNSDYHYTYTISFDDGSIETNVPAKLLTAYEPITEGNDIYGCYSKDDDGNMDECYVGTVIRVMPSGYVSIQYEGDDQEGEVDWMVPPNRYYVAPYMYAGPL